MTNPWGNLKPEIAIYGLGYVGLTLGVVLADSGYQVYGIEPRRRNVKFLRKGKPPIFEAGLEEALGKHFNRSFKFFEKPDKVRADVYVVSVGTPVEGANKTPDLVYVRQVAESIGRQIRPGNLVLLRSTVPVGLTRNFFIPLVEKISKLKAGGDFSVVFAPERTVEGSALAELRSLPQVIGGIDQTSVEKAAQIFESFAPKVIRVSSLESAEMVKLLNNTYRDVIFGFANETALVCDGFNLDPHEIIEAASDGYPRGRIPKPSPGVGGYCLTKDPFILLHSTRSIGFKPQLVFHGRKINESMTGHVVSKILRFLKIKKMRRATVGVLGFAYKGDPETADIRFSPTLDVINHLKRAGMTVLGHDPVIGTAAMRQMGAKPANLVEIFKKSDCVLIMNNHRKYRDASLLEHLTLMNKPGLFFDPWQLHLRKDILKEPGISYSNLGYDSWENHAKR